MSQSSRIKQLWQFVGLELNNSLSLTSETEWKNEWQPHERRRSCLPARREANQHLHQWQEWQKKKKIIWVGRRREKKERYHLFFACSSFPFHYYRPSKISRKMQTRRRGKKKNNMGDVGNEKGRKGSHVQSDSELFYLNDLVGCIDFALEEYGEKNDGWVLLELLCLLT